MLDIQFIITLIFAAPLIAATINSFFICFDRQTNIKTGYAFAIIGILISFILSIYIFSLALAEDYYQISAEFQWFRIGQFPVLFGYYVDFITATMLLVVTSVSLLVQIYSIGYMAGDKGLIRYYTYLSLFTSAMIGVVLSINILQLYFFWELVGVCSYLLIGFWFDKNTARAAAKKAFLITRIGDVGFLFAILLLFVNGISFLEKGLNPLLISDILLMGNELTSSVVLLVSVGIIAGAVGKSAQFPLHTWLPDAMEGPTPVSALIHAATMVAAGVFLLVRFFDFISASPTSLLIIAIIGCITSLLGASIALVMNDIKKVLAYSTISQLGYMFMAIGIGAPAVAMFHLVTHAFFKSLLFLGAGNVSHAVHSFDMEKMGNLKAKMPITYIIFLLGSLSLVGIFPFAGFWSKDEIVNHAYAGVNLASNIVLFASFIGVLMTGFYTFRMVFLTFNKRLTEDSTVDHSNLKESPKVMLFPVVILAFFAVISGLLINPPVSFLIFDKHWFLHYQHREILDINWFVALLSTVLAVLGITAAWIFFKNRNAANTLFAESPMSKILHKKWFFDDFYETVLVKHIFYNGITRFAQLFDEYVINQISDLLGSLGKNLGRPIVFFQNGSVQFYALIITLFYGLVVTLGVLLLHVIS
jgi:NADH-quinone oxidoreductase subunit L